MTLARSTHLVLFYLLFGAVFAIGLGLMGLSPEGTAGPAGPGASGAEAVRSATRDVWFDYRPEGVAELPHVPGLRGVVYDEAIHDMPRPAT